VQPLAQQPQGTGGGELWVEKHKPKHSRELVGNNTLIATLRQWLETWCAWDAW
jgi:replication factor C subunit 1